VSDLNDRRARKKALTREHVRGTAQALFAERGFDDVTVADIARAADVAVQTVFNHFPTKEELFFDGRTPWVDDPARAVRERAPGVSPLTALRASLVETVRERLDSLSCAERRRYVATIEASETLRSHERELVHEAERRLSAALLEAWTAPGAEGPEDPHTIAPITAAVWLAATRVLLVTRRTALTAGGDASTDSSAHAFADRLLAQMEAGLQMLHGAPEQLPHAGDTGWPAPVVLRAG
jgi:AcrR family transcriptional regulator